MRFDIITILPGFFDSFLSESLIKRAVQKKKLAIQVHGLRKWTNDRHRTVDDTPYGGGPGMVLKVEPLYNAIKDVRKKSKKSRVVLLSPRGRRFTHTTARRWSRYDQIVFVCGRYEGVDERVKKVVDETVSVGDFITLGGEVPAMACMEAVARFVPGVVGKAESVTKGDFPQYTKPAEFKPRGAQKPWKVPAVLLSGDHKAIEQWRNKRTKEVAKRKK